MTSSKIRIVRVIARMNIGGPAIHVTLLNSRLDPNRFESTLVTGLENAGEGSLLEWAVTQGVQPLVIPEIVGEATFGPRDVAALRKMYAIIRRANPHIVHTHTAKAGFVGRLAAKMAGAPMIVHTFHGHVLRGYYSPVKTALLNQMEKMLARLTDRIVAVSEAVRRDLIELRVAPAEKVVTVPLGLDLDEFANADRLRGSFRAEHKIARDRKLIGIVGRLALIKNHRLFLEMARQLLTIVPESRFVIVGDGLLRRGLETYAEQLGIREQVIFVGWRRDLASIYADLDILVVSSNNEGTPVSAIEAMASGCPVVATRVGGMPDVVKDGETGFLAPPNDALTLARSAAELLRDSPKRNRMGQAARAVALEHFSVQRLVADTERLYDELLTQNIRKL
jgi:glycosyltransferase involved in cell wall biosynthesis